MPVCVCVCTRRQTTSEYAWLRTMALDQARRLGRSAVSGQALTRADELQSRRSCVVKTNARVDVKLMNIRLDCASAKLTVITVPHMDIIYSV